MDEVEIPDSAVWTADSISPRTADLLLGLGKEVIILVSAHGGRPGPGVPTVESCILQENVGASSSDGKCRGPKQLNLELCPRIYIGAAP